MRIAVTGGSGRIGCHVVRELVSRGHFVINIDRRQAAEPAAQRFVFANLAQREVVQPVLEQVEAVCHLGEIAGPYGGSPEQVLAENVRSGSTVLQTAADLKLSRVIYTSSCQAYGMWQPPTRAVPRRLPFDETQPLAPHNCYALSKATNEAFARLTSEQSGLSMAIFRLPMVVQWEYSDERVRWVAERTQTDGFETYCHVSDVARAYALAIESARGGCEAYHFSAVEILSLIPLAERLKAHHPDYPPLPADWPAFRSPLLIEKAKEHFGWEPQWNFLAFYRAQQEQRRAAGGGT